MSFFAAHKETMTGKDIDKAADFLHHNEVIGIPTETVYGLAGNAFSEDAVLKIFEVKQRPHFDPLIVHTYSLKSVESFVKHIPEAPVRLFNKFSPGPITLLLPKNDKIPDLVTSGLENVAVRIPNHPLTLSLLKKLPFPLAAPSANPFGYISPTSAQHVEKQLGDKIPYILDGGECEVGIESTIVGFENGKTIVYRLGGLSVDDLENVCGKVEVRQSSSKPAAPGMLESHYAPRKPMYIGTIEMLLAKHKDKKVAILSFSKIYEAYRCLNLSPKGDMKEACKNIFKYMRLLDESDCEIIIAEFVPDVGLGKAINDRLKRAGILDLSPV